MTQMEQLMDVISVLPTVGTLEAVADGLEDLRDVSQNPAVEGGGSDGSIDGDCWYLLRDTAHAVRELEECLARLLV